MKQTGGSGEKRWANPATKPEPTRQPKPPASNLRRLRSIFHQHKLKFENFALFSVSLERRRD
jgi:hypothetical protein